MNQLTNTMGGGPVRFAGWLSKFATVQVGGTPAVMGLQNISLVGYAQTSLGTNIATITVADHSTNVPTNRYQCITAVENGF